MRENFSITLIQCPCWGRETPPLALALLAGNLRSKGYEVYLFDLNNWFYHVISENYKQFWHQEEYKFWQSPETMKEMLEYYDVEIEAETNKVLEKGSQLIGFSVETSSLHFTLEITKRIKNKSPNTLIAVGGPETGESFTGLRFIDNPNIDAVVLGEGDETLPRMCADLKEKGYFTKIPGLVFKKDGGIINGGLREPIKSLEAIPLPDYSDFDLSKYANPNRLDIFGSRGCINKCHFCYEWKYFHRLRFRSGENLFEEVKHHLSTFPNVNYFNMNDSALNISPRAIRRFSELLLENNVRIIWGGWAIIRECMTPDLLKLMARAGCDYLFYGVESGSNRVLKSMNKKSTRELAAQILGDTHKAGINTTALFMVGYPTETEEDFQMTLDFIRQNHKWITSVCPSQAFTAIMPNTYLYENPKEFGVENVDHSLFWTSQNGKNTYPIRFDRYERLCKLCIELGLLGPGVVEERADKWKLFGEYYQYIRDYQGAMNCYFKDLLKHGYSPESVRGFFECYDLSQGKKETYQLPYQGINKLISLYNVTINTFSKP